MENDPKEIKAKFDCECAETKKPIRKGELCIYYPLERKSYSLSSKTAEQYQSWAFDVHVLGNNY